MRRGGSPTGPVPGPSAVESPGTSGSGEPTPGDGGDRASRVLVRAAGSRFWRVGGTGERLPVLSGGAEVKRKVYLTFPQALIREPILYTVGQKFKVIPNIRGASISEEIGFVALELTGDADEVDRAVQYFKDLGVKVEPITGASP
jgi:hypothetical protein